MSVPARLLRWLSPPALMAVIFWLSAQPDFSSGLGVIDSVGRKIVHVAEYGLLCGLWWRALQTVATPRSALVGAFAIAVAYAATDEFHQAFVPGRTGSPVDVAIDTLGAGLVAIAIRRRLTMRTAAAE